MTLCRTTTGYEHDMLTDTTPPRGFLGLTRELSNGLKKTAPPVRFQMLLCLQDWVIGETEKAAYSIWSPQAAPTARSSTQGRASTSTSTRTQAGGQSRTNASISTRKQASGQQGN